MTRSCYYSVRKWSQGTQNRLFFPVAVIFRCASLTLALILTILTLIRVPRGQKTIYFFCLRRRIVTSCQRKMNLFHWSRIGLKGSVQRKLRWVENGFNRSVRASDCGAGHSFVILFGFHLGFAIFPFPVSTAQIIGEFWINRWSGANDLAPIELALYGSHS